MNKSGSPDQAPGVSPAPAGAAPTRRPPLALVLLLILGLALAAFVGSNVIGVLFGLVAPPTPPVQADFTERAYVSKAYGVDTWTYTSPREACSVASEYGQGALCEYAPLQCGALREEPPASLDRQIAARCFGIQSFSIFTMQWTAYIYAKPDASTEIEIDREVFWVGEGRR